VINGRSLIILYDLLLFPINYTFFILISLRFFVSSRQGMEFIALRWEKS